MPPLRTLAQRYILPRQPSLEIQTWTGQHVPRALRRVAAALSASLPSMSRAAGAVAAGDAGAGEEVDSRPVTDQGPPVIDRWAFVADYDNERDLDQSYRYVSRRTGTAEASTGRCQERDHMAWMQAVTGDWDSDDFGEADVGHRSNLPDAGPSHAAGAPAVAAVTTGQAGLDQQAVLQQQAGSDQGGGGKAATGGYKLRKRGTSSKPQQPAGKPDQQQQQQEAGVSSDRRYQTRSSVRSLP